MTSPLELVAKGPHIVAIGGGHGLSTFLRGLKAHTRNLTAVVTVADDGGSSGKIRESVGILPPGDIRNCLAALSNDEAMLTQLFQYRFSGSPDLEGHSFGNLFITALADITGSFESAVVESGRVLSVNGRVLPSTLHDVKLVASMELPHSLTEVRVDGESRIPAMAGRVRRVWLEPDSAPAFSRRLAWGGAALLILLSGWQDYDLVFHKYYQQYRTSAWNSSEMGQAARKFIGLSGSPESVWVVGYPHWVDTRLVALNAGFPGRDFQIFPEQLESTLSDKGLKMFILNPQDATSMKKLAQLYPAGWFQEVQSEVESKDFTLFLVPPDRSTRP